MISVSLDEYFLPNDGNHGLKWTKYDQSISAEHAFVLELVAT